MANVDNFVVVRDSSATIPRAAMLDTFAFIARVSLLALIGVLRPPIVEHVPTEGPSIDVFEALPDPCDGDLDCPSHREVFVDYDALGIPGLSGGDWVAYDYDEVTAPLKYTDLFAESELSLAVRLIVSEVGADRLLVNRYGLLEAIGILYTVDNRLDPSAYNPLNVRGAPEFPGCGPEGTFADCINAQQYLGMATWRALDPASRYDADVLVSAVDVAVMAWWLQENRLVEDFTDGATSYVHRCGGRAYGMTTPHCDGQRGRDVPGANPYTGPLVFKAPSCFARGTYKLAESLHVHYDPWLKPKTLADDDGVAEVDDEIWAVW